MKNACIRFRNHKSISNEEQDLINQGYAKVFDTIKSDHHYLLDKGV